MKKGGKERHSWDNLPGGKEKILLPEGGPSQQVFSHAHKTKREKCKSMSRLLFCKKIEPASFPNAQQKGKAQSEQRLVKKERRREAPPATRHHIGRGGERGIKTALRKGCKNRHHST